MSTTPRQVFSFDEYTVRPAGEQDREHIEHWIASDPFHRNRLDVDYFLSLRPGEECYALENQNGHVVFYFKTQSAVRISIQFGPSTDPASRRSNSIALLKGMRWIEGLLRHHHYREVLFDTEGPQLREFAEKHLGFAGASVMTKTLYHPLPASKMAPRPCGNDCHKGLERTG
jgi:hypothetical protein